jgi:hypothetical protein
MLGVVTFSLSSSTGVTAATLSDGFKNLLEGSPLSQLGASFASAVGRSVPVIAASPAFHYEFDPETGSFMRQQATGGQLFLEHAELLGRGHLALGVDYLHVQFDRLDGLPLRDLGESIIRVSGLKDPKPTIRLRHLSIDVTADEAFVSFTYGVLDRVDLNLAIPLVSTRLGLGDVVDYNFTKMGDIVDYNTTSHSSSDTAFGVGDVELRAKARLGASAGFATAVGLGLRLPTGNKDDFQGTGDTEVTPTLIVSTPTWRPGGDLSLQGHLNLSMLLDVNDVGGRSEGRWGVGMDVEIHRWQLAIALLGRDATGPILSEKQLDFPACIGPARACVPTVEPPAYAARRPLFGLSGGRPDYLDASIGIRAPVWKDRVTAVVGMLAPLLDQGLITEPTPVVGLEAVF